MQLTKLLTTLMAAAFLLGACNTMEGLGEDIQSGGQKLESEAERNK